MSTIYHNRDTERSEMRYIGAPNPLLVLLLVLVIINVVIILEYLLCGKVTMISYLRKDQDINFHLIGMGYFQD